MGDVVSFDRRPRLHAAPLARVQDLPTAPEPVTLRALVADDDEWSRHLLRSYLLTEGVDVESAQTGDEAAERFLTMRPDIVFLDVEMPGRNGLDVLALIRQQTFETAVVITTAFGTDRLVATALRCGADDYLRKPFERSDLQAVLDRTIARLLLTRQNAALRAQVLEHQRQLDQELARAAAVVRDLLPSQPPSLAGFELAATCLPARELGGDFYDWQELPDGRFSVTVGDVMGKGLPAALLMATVRAVLRALSADHSPSDAVQQTAAALEHDLARSGAFVTLFHAQIDRNGQVRYVDAGHGYVLLRRANGRVQGLEPWGLPLGVDPEERYAEGALQLDPGDVLLIYSDGLIEARPDRFAGREALAALAADQCDAQAIVAACIAAVADRKPLPDDLTLVTLRRTASIYRFDAAASTPARLSSSSETPPPDASVNG